jgi:replicative superfamily II helicase
MAGFDLGKIAQSAAASVPVLTHPRDIYNALPAKPKGYEYLRGPQDQVLDAWYTRRTARDLVIKMNTGGGKTIVGLVAALSSLNEGKGPVAYLVPDHFLAEQVRDEAKMLGIPVTGDAKSAAYTGGRAVLVDVFSRLFNGLSIFGVSGTVSKPPTVSLGTLIIDDAHACLKAAKFADWGSCQVAGVRV